MFRAYEHYLTFRPNTLKRRLASVPDFRRSVTTYTYNAFGDVTGEVSPDRGTLSYTVDKAGNITQRTDARGVVTDYTWDALNRVTAVE